MRIMNKDQFARTPKGTVYCLFPHGSEGLQVKSSFYMSDGKPYFNGVIPLEPTFESPDEWYDGIPSEKTMYNTACWSVDTALCDYDADQLFAVFSKDEVRRMIDVLTYALCDGETRCYTDDDNMVMR